MISHILTFPYHLVEFITVAIMMIIIIAVLNQNFIIKV